MFPRTRLPFDQALVDVHPETGRPVYLIPWGEVTLVGSTAIEHQGSLDEEPRISRDEASYLMHWLRATLPGAGLSFSDVLSTFSGLRPIVDRGDPRVAQASREHAVWEESGLVTVTGGKLTTFQRIADDALQALRDRLEIPERAGGDSPVLDPLPAVWSGLPFPWATSQRLMARYGAAGLEWIAGRPSFELQRLPGRSTLVAELRWVARHEAVRHLDDLLLRRVRIGLTSPEGGLPHIESIRLALRDDLGWDGRRWREEILSYERLWWRSYGPPVAPRTRGREREVSVA